MSQSDQHYGRGHPAFTEQDVIDYIYDHGPSATAELAEEFDVTDVAIRKRLKSGSGVVEYRKVGNRLLWYIPHPEELGESKIDGDGFLNRNQTLAIGSRMGTYLGVLAIGITAGTILTANVTASACNTNSVITNVPPVCSTWMPIFQSMVTGGAVVGAALLLSAAYVDQRVVDWEAIE